MLLVTKGEVEGTINTKEGTMMTTVVTPISNNAQNQTQTQLEMMTAHPSQGLTIGWTTMAILKTTIVVPIASSRDQATMPESKQ